MFLYLGCVCKILFDVILRSEATKNLRFCHKYPGNETLREAQSDIILICMQTLIINVIASREAASVSYEICCLQTVNGIASRRLAMTDIVEELLSAFSVVFGFDLARLHHAPA